MEHVESVLVGDSGGADCADISAGGAAATVDIGGRLVKGRLRLLLAEDVVFADRGWMGLSEAG